MRRTDRQMDRDSAWQAVDACCFGTVSMLLPEGEPYCVPLSIARIGETLYFHWAQEGLKLKALRKHPAVCVSCVGMAEPVHDKFTTRYTSAILTGTAREVTDDAEKIILKTEDGQNVKGYPCTPCIVGTWKDVYESEKILRNNADATSEGDKLSALTQRSFLVCAYGGLIEPISSGQEEE